MSKLGGFSISNFFVKFCWKKRSIVHSNLGSTVYQKKSLSNQADFNWSTQQINMTNFCQISLGKYFAFIWNIEITVVFAKQQQ